MQKLGLILLIMIFFSCGEETTAPDTSDNPTNLQLILIENTSILLQWIDNSDSESGFIIQRRNDSDTSFSTIDSLEVDSEMYLDQDLEMNQKYFYRVAAILPDGISSFTNVASMTTQSTVADLSFGNETSFEVMTWNIEKFPRNEDVTVGYVWQIIHALQIDVIAMQEIKEVTDFETVIDELNNHDESSNWTGDIEICDQYGNNLAFLYRASEFEDVTIYPILDNDWYAFPRSPFVFEANYMDEQFYIINNHLKAGGSSEDETRRRQACEKLDEFITTNLPSKNVIILGDLNDELIDDNNVFEVFFDQPDEYIIADLDIANGATDFWSYPSWPSHLDHIFLSNELNDEWQNTDYEIKTIQIDDFLTGGFNDYDDDISDHLPVAIKMKIENK